MPQTRSLFEVRRFCESVTAAGGTIPDILQHLLDGADLIAAHSATQAPAAGIVDQLAAGKLDSRKLGTLIEEAARQRLVADYAGDLRIAVEPVIVTRFHKALGAGAAGEILSSLRGHFDAAATQIAKAKSAIGSGESDPSHVLATGNSETVECWQQLPAHLAVVAGIGRIAAQFGVRQTSAFSLVSEYGLADNYKLADEALTCTTGNLVADSAGFQRPDRGHVSSPWYRAGGLRLWTVEEVRQRYSDFAASEFDRVHSGRPGGRIGEDGTVIYDVVPPNPFRRQEANA